MVVAVPEMGVQIQAVLVVERVCKTDNLRVKGWDKNRLRGL